MALTFQRATKRQARARVAVLGPAGGGKTMTSLLLAQVLGGRVALIDTEHGTASKYADLFDFDTLVLKAPFSPERYIEAIRAAGEAGYDVLVIDSASHEWNGAGGCLEIVDQVARQSSSRNSYVAWGQVTPRHNAFIQAILHSPCHVVATFRSKMDYIQTEEHGRKKIERVGLAPVTREGAEYEFDLILDMLPAERGRKAAGSIVKSRAGTAVPQGSFWEEPGADLGAAIKAWLSDGAEPVDEPAAEPDPTPAPRLRALPGGMSHTAIAQALAALPGGMSHTAIAQALANHPDKGRIIGTHGLKPRKPTADAIAQALAEVDEEVVLAIAAALVKDAVSEATAPNGDHHAVTPDDAEPVGAEETVSAAE